MVDKKTVRPVPRCWPTAVSPPGSESWEATAAAWLAGLLPELREYPTTRRHPVVLAFIARTVLTGAVEGARQAYRTARTELGGLLPPHAIGTVLRELRAEGERLSAALHSVELVERALRIESGAPTRNP